MTATFILGLGGLGATEIIVILIIVVLLFGGKKIPELMKGLGKGVKDFKEASKGEEMDNTTTNTTNTTTPGNDPNKK